MGPPLDLEDPVKSFISDFQDILQDKNNTGNGNYFFFDFETPRWAMWKKWRLWFVYSLLLIFGFMFMIGSCHTTSMQA